MNYNSFIEETGTYEEIYSRKGRGEVEISAKLLTQYPYQGIKSQDMEVKIRVRTEY